MPRGPEQWNMLHGSRIESGITAFFAQVSAICLNPVFWWAASGRLPDPVAVHAFGDGRPERRKMKRRRLEIACSSLR